MLSKSTAPPFTTKEEQENDKGIKVSPSAWKWPRTWPYNADYFSRKVEESIPLNSASPSLAPVYDMNAAAAMRDHYARFIPQDGAVLELGASAHSYLPDDLQLSKLVGVGVNEEEMIANPRLTEKRVQDLNADQTLPFEESSFDTVVLANSIEFFVKPREVLRETWRVLKPGGNVIISFASKNRVNEDRQIKIWGTMNDDQRIWIVGSFIFFACSEGFVGLRGYDLSESDSKGMMAGLSGKTPLHIIQATKAALPTEEADIATRMKAMLWTAASMEAEDKALCLARMYAAWDRETSPERQIKLFNAVGSLPRIYAVLQEMGNAIPLQLKAILATRIAEEYHGTEEELVQLRQGLGLNEPSEEFWAPLGKMTGMMNAEDKVLLLAECVPMHVGTADEKAALGELITVLPQVIEDVKSKLPDITKTDAQLLAVDLCVTDFLHEPAESRASFLEWVKGLNGVDMSEFLKARMTYKEVAVPSAEI